MADYRLKMMLPAQRSKGRSAVAMAAYRSAERLTDERLGNVHDYERRGGVLFSEIVLPEDAPPPEWAQDRGAFWNKVEAAETRKNSQVAREIVLSLPHELTAEVRQEITLEFARHVADTYGIGVDVNIHAPSVQGDQRNHHAHLMLTTRQLDSESSSGFGEKVRTLDGISERQAKREGDQIDHLREVWRDMQNLVLKREDVRDERGELVQVDHRSYERQGVDREGTEHEGYVATAIKRRGGHSDLVADNDNIRQRNAERDELIQQVEESREAIAEELTAIHRTPDEDKIKFKFHDSETVQGIFAELDAERRGHAYTGTGKVAPHLFRAGDSNRIAALNTELASDSELTQPVAGQADFLNDFVDAGQRRQRQPDLEAEARDRDFYKEHDFDPTLDLEPDPYPWGGYGRPLDDDLLDTDPRPYDDLDDPDNPDHYYPPPDSYPWGGYGRSQVAAVNPERAASEEETGSQEKGGREEKGRGGMDQPSRLENDPRPATGLPTEPSDAEPSDPELSKSEPQAVRPWRWRGLDAFNQELAELEDEKHRKEREGDGSRQFANNNERLDTDPKPDEYERQRGGPGYRR